MNKEDQIELVEKYIEKTTTEAEVKDFEKLLLEEESFRDLYHNMKAHITAIRNVSRKELLEDLKKIEGQLPDVKIAKPQRKIKWIGWSIAAAACMAGMIWAIGFLIPDHGNQFDKIYALEFEPYRNIVTAYNRSGDIAITIKEQALSEYTLGNFKKAIEKFLEIKVSDRDAVIHFYLGNAYMATGKINEARDNFSQVLSQDSLFIDQTKWYLALSYIKSHNINLARVSLNELTNHESAYKTKAEELLHTFKSN
jgi:tetratricopeptide (TPR) repeat protein